MQTRLRYLIRGAVWLGLALVTLELCARFDDWFTDGADPLGLYDQVAMVDFDSLGQRGRPFARYRKWRHNSLGYRGPEVPAQGCRVLCIGSSETYGQAESEGMEWPRQVERRLNQAAGGARFAVINTALAGESLPTSRKRLPETVARTQPQAAILYPSLAHYLTVPFLGEVRPPPPRRFVWRIADRADTVLKRNLPEPVQTALKAWQTSRAERGYAKIWSEMPPELRQAFRLDLENMVADLRARGIRPFLVTHVNRFGPAVKPEERFMLSSWRRFYPMLKEEAFLPMEASMNDVIREVARQTGTPLIDPVARMPSGPDYFSDFVHFTNRGAAAFSSLVADGILAQWPDADSACDGPQAGVKR